MRPSVVWRALAAGALLTTFGRALADAVVSIMVLKEHGVGTQALAQPYLDRMATLAARQNGWSGASGKYFTSRGAAGAFIASDHPHYGILSLPAFLAMRERYKLQIIGRVAVSIAGGRRYYLISRTAKDLARCKGQTLATDHADDPFFVDRVVFAGQAKLADFTLQATQRPLQTIKAVVTGQSSCALIDDAQKDALDHLAEKDGVAQVWESRELPPMPVVAFPSAPSAERAAFKKNLDNLCNGDGKSVCEEVGIDDLAETGDQDYAGVVAAYGK